LDLIYREEQARRATQAANSLTGLLLVLLVALTWFYLQARKAQRQAIEANQAKTDFLANISHEIRTPLNGILGLTEVLESSQLDSRQRGLLKSLRDSGRNLLAIVNDLLDLALVARGKFTLKPEPVALKDLLEGAAQPFQLAAEAKKLQFEMIGTGSLPAFVRADPVRMRQIVSNLIGNAVKFTDHGSVIVRVHWSSGQNRLRLSVEDTGIGMSEAAQARLFEKFYQADSSISRRFGGTGLGLAIVKEMVTAMDGSIAVESQQGSGSKFLIELPLEAVAGAAGEPPPAAGPAPRSEKARVLVVEDNEVNQLVVRSLLAMAGHEVDCAHDGVQGLEAWKLKPYDLVLMDCQMPNLDGYQATSLIRQIEGTERRTPIVALTASAMPGDRERCYEAGMDDFLSKPVHAAELQRVLNAWVKKETQIPVSQH
jgi:signal transduction histidine kinase/CheY-like chemotaxis protein